MPTAIVVVKNFLNSKPRYKGIEANEQMLIKAAEQDPGLPDICDIFNRTKHRLGTNSNYENAYREFFSRHPEYASEANRPIFDGAIVESGDEVTVENLEDLLQPGNPRNVLDQICLTPKAVQAQADVAERERLIKEISQGRSTYSARNNYGALVSYRTADLDGDSLERLREIYSIVTEQRTQKAQDPKALRKEINVTMKQQWDEKTATKTTTPDVVLINPSTGVEYTKPELLSFMGKADRPTLRKFFFYDSGLPRPGVKEAVDRIFGVKPRPQVGHAVQFSI